MTTTTGTGTASQTAEESHAPETPRAYYRPSPLPGLSPAIALFFFVYWLVLGFMLQRVDFSQPPEWWQAVIAALPLLDIVPVQLVTFLTQAFSPRILRHVLIPALIGWWLAGQAAAGFMQHFYQFSSRAEAARFLNRLQVSSQQGAGTAITPSSSGHTRMRLVMALTLITLPFAVAFLLLFLYSLQAPPSPNSRPIYSVILVLLGGVWAVTLVAYLLNRFMGSAPVSSGLYLGGISLAESRQRHALLRVGGPGKVIVGDSDAIVTEYNGRYSRSLGAGARRLRPYEYVRAIIDLHPQERDGEVCGITLDGVEVKTQIALTFRISNDDSRLSDAPPLSETETESASRPTREVLYPFGEKALRLAAYAETVMGPDEALTWKALPLLTATEEFRDAVGENNLETLFDPEAEHPVAHPTILDRVTKNTKRTLRKYGIKLISLRLGPLRTPEAVMAQNLNGWRAYWEKAQKLREAGAYADRLMATRYARQEAEVAVLRAILKGIQEARREGSVQLTHDVAMHLLEALERIVEDVPQETESSENSLLQ